MRPGDEGEASSVTASIASTLTVEDTTSMASVDSTQVPYQNIDHSTDSNSISFDKTSVSERSDTEVLLKSECGDADSSHGAIGVSVSVCVSVCVCVCVCVEEVLVRIWAENPRTLQETKL